MVDSKDNKASLSDKKSISTSKLFFYIFSLFLFVFAIYYFSEIEKEFILLEKVNIGWLIAAIAAQLITYLLNALTYQALIKGYGIHPYPRLLELYKVSVISLFFNQAVPSAGISGNTFIFNFLRRKKINTSQIISVILLDLLIFYLAMNIYLVFLLATKLFFYKLPSVFGGLLIGGIIVYLVFGSLILLFAKKSSLDFLIRKFKKIKLIRKYAERFERLQPGIETGENIALMYFISRHKKIVAKILFWQLLAVLSDAITILFLFYGLGIPISLFTTLLVLICTRVISILPFLPGSLILYESSMTVLFSSLGTSLGTAVMVTLLFRLLSFWLPMPFGWLLYRRWLQLDGGSKKY